MEELKGLMKQIKKQGAVWRLEDIRSYLIKKDFRLDVSIDFDYPRTYYYTFRKPYGTDLYKLTFRDLNTNQRVFDTIKILKIVKNKEVIYKYE